MEPEEPRKLRIAHRLTPAELAGLLGTSSDDVLCWEAAKNQPLSHTDRTGHSPEHSATAPDLARAPEGARSARGGPHEREAVLGPAVRARAYRHLHPPRPNDGNAPSPTVSGARGRTRTGDLRFRKPPHTVHCRPLALRTRRRRCSGGRDTLINT